MDNSTREDVLDSASCVSSFLNITRRNLLRHADTVQDCLKKSTVVSFSVHSTVAPQISHWIPGESLQEHYLRLTDVALKCELFGLGISCAKIVSAGESGQSADLPRNQAINRISVQNFNITLGTAATSVVSLSSFRRMLGLGYDLNHTAQEGVLYYRGRDDAVHHSEESKLLRDIFLAVHGDGSHPVVVENGLLDVILAYTTLSGLPGDGVDEFLQRLHDLFPGKLVEAISLKPSQSINALPVATNPAVPGDEDVFPLLSIPVVNPVNSGPNLGHPAVFESFGLLKSFLQCVDLEDDQSVRNVAEKYGNRVMPVGAPGPVQIQPLPHSKFRPTKKRKIEYDFTIPLGAIVEDKSH